MHVVINQCVIKEEEEVIIYSHRILQFSEEEDKNKNKNNITSSMHHTKHSLGNTLVVNIDSLDFESDITSQHDINDDCSKRFRKMEP